LAVGSHPGAPGLAFPECPKAARAKFKEADGLSANQTSRPRDDANLQQVFLIEKLTFGTGHSTEFFP